MFNWEVRQFALAEMIRMANVDVVALQEVRVSADGTFSQMRDLQRLLPHVSCV
jgi:hypothetical protein